MGRQRDHGCSGNRDGCNGPRHSPTKIGEVCACPCHIEAPSQSLSDMVAEARTDGAKAERARVVAIVDAHLADLRTAHASSVRDASPHWVRTIENMIDSVTVLRGRIKDHEPKESGDG